MTNVPKIAAQKAKTVDGNNNKKSSSWSSLLINCGEDKDVIITPTGFARFMIAFTKVLLLAENHKAAVVAGEKIAKGVTMATKH